MNDAHPTEGTSIGDSAIDKREKAVISESKPVEDVNVETKSSEAVVPPTFESPHIDGLRCATCREIKQDSQLMKQPLDYRLNPDGSASPYAARYSLFCGTCQKFLGIYDPVAQKELADMIKTRNEIENKRA